ncbi:unnamed protein product [Danaus chrysippus]|uniref:(African queen) hypothetical protein n=1 Tax=Danaus chrysippus TaxID=151541 RepID=A0A8J2R934_9NEOP|nr:unnamed protein product [Danaus chrysippus]
MVVASLVLKMGIHSVRSGPTYLMSRTNKINRDNNAASSASMTLYTIVNENDDDDNDDDDNDCLSYESAVVKNY